MLSDSIPGPANLNAVIDAAQAVTHQHRPVPPPKKKGRHNSFLQQNTSSSTGTTHMVQDKPIDPTSVNAVVRLLELADPKALKWQCRICTYIQTTTASMHENSKCECCLLPTVSAAPVTAVISPDVLRTAMTIRENVSNVLQQQYNGTAPTTPSHVPKLDVNVNPTPRLSTTLTPKGKTQRSRQPPVPVLHSNEQCCICESDGVEKYCSSCKCHNIAQHVISNFILLLLIIKLTIRFCVCVC